MSTTLSLKVLIVLGYLTVNIGNRGAALAAGAPETVRDESTELLPIVNLNLIDMKYRMPRMKETWRKTRRHKTGIDTDVFPSPNETSISLPSNLS